MEFPTKNSGHRRVSKKKKKVNLDEEETERILADCEEIHINQYMIEDEDFNQTGKTNEELTEEEIKAKQQLYEDLRDTRIFQQVTRIQSLTNHYILYRIIIWEEGDEAQELEIFNFLSKEVQKEKPVLGWLGLCYMFGCGVEQDLDEAFELFKKGCKKDEGISQYGMGWCYGNGFGVEKNDEFRIRYYKLAAEQNVRGALTDLGVCYDDGIGVKSDLEKAFNYYKAAADQGCRVALNRIGVLYYNGQGVERNVEQAIDNYEKSAELGYKYAMWNLGLNYEEGNLIPQDFKKSKLWYQKAAGAGVVEAQQRLERWDEICKRAKKSYKKRQKKEKGDDDECTIF